MTWMNELALTELSSDGRIPGALERRDPLTREVELGVRQQAIRLEGAPEPLDAATRPHEGVDDVHQQSPLSSRAIDAGDLR